MRRFFLLAFLPLFFFGRDAAAQGDYFQQFVHYTIRASLDTKNHMLTGSEKILYTNNSPDTLSEFYLHLYPNAYRGEESALIKHYRQRFNYSLLDIPKKFRSYLKISDVTVGGEPVDVTIDDTVARFALPQPLAPGQSLEISMSFEEKIRRQVGRAGYRGDHYDMAQWYPKVAVYDENGFDSGKWVDGEFYGEFGDFDVFIELPAHFVVAATGVLQEGDPGWSLNPVRGGGKNKDTGTNKTVHFQAKNVHDFAWCADPDFVVQDSTWNGIEVRSFFHKRNWAWRDSTLAHGVRAVQWLDKFAGPYPYPQVSIVQALLRGGMEYPMLVMNGSVSERLVLHEVGHIYFYGILGNNEHKEAWLDEGFTTFQTSRYVIDRYGPEGMTWKRSLYERITPQYPVLEAQRHRIFPLLRKGYGERVSMPAADFKNDYGAMVYTKASLVLHSLRYVVGDETFNEIMRAYYDKWKLKHVNEARFRDVCEDVAGRDLGWFFEQWLHSTKVCDYHLDKVETTQMGRNEGFRVDVRIERVGEIVMPLDIVFTFDDGTTETHRVDGRLRRIEQTYELAKKPKRTAVNPENEIMDIDMSDNFSPRRRVLQIDWPGNDYYPETAYQIRHHPFVWYNDVDRARVGYHVRGTYANWTDRGKLGIYYGTESERLDFIAGYRKPAKLFRNNGTITVLGFKLEGRQDAVLEYTLRRRKAVLSPPTHQLKVGLNYNELTDDRYIRTTNGRNETYQTGSEVAPYFAYEVGPQFDVMRSRVMLELRLGREWFGGEWDYSRIITELEVKNRQLFWGIDVRARFFGGSASGNVPYQQKLYLANGGPIAADQKFFLRSAGSLPDDFYYHEPGQGNLRGYLAGNFGVNQLIAFNFEMGTRLPFVNYWRWTKKLFRTTQLTVFADVGRSFDSVNPIDTSPRVQALVDAGVLDGTIADAGFGIRLYKEMRFEFPIWVNQPAINGESKETKARWLFSLTSAF